MTRGFDVGGGNYSAGISKGPARPLGVNGTDLERGSKGRQPLGGVRGVPEKPLFPFLRAAAGGTKEKRPG